ncbi:MAG: ZIP family metal transporter [Candidatus Pacebacteria bacterium]|nr:ZIP family metal transporter [Candidatus Paceibacterota bacterium]
MVFIFISLTFFSACLGGLIGIKWRDKMHLTLGFTAGVLISVVAFDLLPELVELADETGINLRLPMIALVVGFLLFHIAEKSLLIHHAHEDQYGHHHHPTVGIFSSLALSAHSFLDGVGIGFGFQVSNTLGITMAFAVLAHNFTDGLNTVSLMLAHKNSLKTTFKFLFINAIAPVLGGISTLFFTFSSTALVLYLGFFAGFLLYIGASDILPEAHSQDSSYKTILMTILGVVVVFLLTGLITG